MHYSVIESSGHVELTVVKKQKEAPSINFGVRTVNGTAKPNSDYKEIDEKHVLAE